MGNSSLLKKGLNRLSPIDYSPNKPNSYRCGLVTHK